MNGNFEFDKGSYPFGAVAIGDACKVLHVPSQQITVNVGLPRPVASHVALRLNTQYYAWKAGGDVFDGSSPNVGKIIREETRHAFDRKDISGVVATQISLKLTELGL